MTIALISTSGCCSTKGINNEIGTNASMLEWLANVMADSGTAPFCARYSRHGGWFVCVDGYPD